MVLPAAFFGGCAVGQVVQPFSPKKVNPSPYNPEPVWNANTDPTLLAIQGLKRKTGQTTPPGGATTAALTPGGTPGRVTPVPGPIPGPTPVPPGPGPRIPLATDPVYGVVRDRIEGGVIPNATVVLTDKRGGLVAYFVTNSYGEYSFVDVVVGGYYNVTATANGYSQAPLSSIDFSYFGIPVTANLELIYNKPFQIIEGGNFNALGNIGYYVTDGTISDTPPSLASPQVDPVISKEMDIINLGAGGTPDAMKVPFYSGSTQQTYNAIKFEDVHGDWNKLPGNIYSDAVAKDPLGFALLQYQTGGSAGTINNTMYDLNNYGTGTAVKNYSFPGYLGSYDVEPWAEYNFIVPAPTLNKYSYDGLWVTFPNRFKVDDQNAWVTGGDARYFYYNWVDAVWTDLGTTLSRPLGYIPFVGVNAGTGQVSVIASAFDSNPFVLTQAKLDYDYRKDTAAPTFYEQHAVTAPGSVYWVVKLQEQGFVRIDYTGPASGTSSVVYYEGAVGNIPQNPTTGFPSPITGLAAGTYSYTITASDLPGNIKSYGPYSFIIP